MGRKPYDHNIVIPKSLPPYDPFISGDRLFLLRPPEIFRKVSIEVFGVNIVPQFIPNKRK